MWGSLSEDSTQAQANTRPLRHKADRLVTGALRLSVAGVRRPDGRTSNDCWLLSERSRVQTQGLQTLTSAYFSVVEPVIYFGTPVDLAWWSIDLQAGRAHNGRNLTGLTASGYVQALVRVPVISLTA